MIGAALDNPPRAEESISRFAVNGYPERRWNCADTYFAHSSPKANYYI